MSNRINIETFHTKPVVALITHYFEFIEKSHFELANQISNFRRFYGDRLKNDVVAYSVTSKAYPHSLLVIFTVGDGESEPPFALATFYTEVANLYSENGSDQKDTGHYILADNVRISDASDVAGFTEKVNQKAYEILQRINGF